MSATSKRNKPASTDEWRDIARVPNLHYHILSWPEKRETGWTQQEFYAVGRADWEDYRDQWRHYSRDLGGTCVEIGCGAGRLTHAMAADFDRVVGLDVSADMIREAQNESPGNVEYRQVDGTAIPLADGEAQAVFSAIVLQHLETFDDVRAYLADAHRALAPGGSIMINLALSRRQRTALERLRGELRIWRSRRGLKKGRIPEAVRWNEYPWEQVLRMLQDIGYEDIQLRMFPVRSNGAHHPFWFATRA